MIGRYVEPDYIETQPDYIQEWNWGSRKLSPVIVAKLTEKDAIIGNTVPITILGTQTEIEVTYG